MREKSIMTQPLGRFCALGLVASSEMKQNPVSSGDHTRGATRIDWINSSGVMNVSSFLHPLG